MSIVDECYYHPGRPMIGLCRKCGKAACRDCLEAIAGGMLCVDCAFIAHDTYVAAVQSTIVRAQWRVLHAGLCGIIGLVAGIYIGWVTTIGHNGNPLAILGYGLLCQYMGWGWYWGGTMVTTWWRRLFSGWLIVGSLRFLAFVFLIVPLTASCVIGVFGGGIAAYLHNRDLIARMQAAVDAAASLRRPTRCAATAHVGRRYALGTFPTPAPSDLIAPSPSARRTSGTSSRRR